MPVVNCPTCRQALSVPDGAGGAVVTCPHCKQPMTVPAFPPAAVVPAAVVAPPAFVEPFAVPDPEPPRRRGRDRDDERDPAPAGRDRKPDWTLLILLGGTGVFGLIGVVIVVWMLAGSTKASPTGKDKQPEQVKVNRPAPQPKTKAEAVAASGKMDDAAIARIKKATVYIRLTNGKSVASGSGFFVDKGSVVTNEHVINPKGMGRGAKIEVVVQSGTTQEQTFPARVVGADPGKDLALLEVPGAFAPDPLKVSDTAHLRETHEVYAFGFPFGERLGSEITVTKTTVSSLRSGGDRGRREVQLNGGLERGNSGGPVTDSSGRVIGVAVSGIVGTTINFAIDGEEVQAFLARFLDR